MSEVPSHRLKRAKAALRREVLAGRDALGVGDRAARSEAIAVRLLAMSEAAAARRVMAFWSFGSEVDTRPLIDRLMAEGRTMALPRVSGSELVPAVYASGEPLTETTYGTMEPASGRALDPLELDLVVVPGVAFDRSGGRVGYGAGFYDRLLRRVREETPAIAVAFVLQVVEAVPVGRGDVAVDAIVTEDEVIRCRPAGGARRPPSA